MPAETLSEAEVKQSHRNVISKAASGTVWTVLTYSAAQIVRLGSSIVLSRLFAPQYFGLMALLNTVIMGLTLFSDVGLAPSVIRSEEGDDAGYLNTVWTLQVIRGVALWAACVLFAWPIATFYNDQRLMVLVPVLGLSLVFSGFTSTSILTFNRHMEVRKVTLLELGMQLLQFAATVVFALVNRSVWALVIGKLVADFVRMAVSHRLIQGYRNRFGWNKRVLGELIKFGKWIFASTALTFLSSQSDRLVLGKLVSMVTLGLYGVAFALADIPRQIIMAFRGYVGLPFVSKFSSLPRPEFRAILLRYRRIVLVAGAILLAIGVNCSDLFLIRIYDHRYRGAAWMVPILALGLWHTILYSTSMPCLTVLGKVSYTVIGYVFTAAVLILGVPSVFAAWGLIGGVWLIAFSDLPVYACNLWGLWRENLLTLRQDLEMTVLFVAICASLFWLRGTLGIAWSSPVPLR